MNKKQLLTQSIINYLLQQIISSAMMRRKSLLLTLLPIFASILVVNGEFEEQACPVDCQCYYFRINWVTDCSDSNLTNVPLDELSLNVYILDMNSNNVQHLESFPPEIKLRRLQMAHNNLTEISYESFRGLNYLLDADFSWNNIKTIDPEAFR